MRNVYTCIDIGSDSIKIVVCELYHGRYNLLATATIKSKGIKKGLITDVLEAKNCIKKCFNDIESILGFKIKKVIAIIPSYFSEFNMIKGEIEIQDSHVSGKDIVNVLQNAMRKSLEVTKEMVTIIPIDFSLDNEITKFPLGKITKNLRARAIMVSVPKKNIYSVVELLNSIGITAVDISLGCIGDINTFRDENVDQTISCVINIGSEKTEVSLYNKGIIVKQNIINMGSKNVDNDIAYIYKVDIETAKELKEKFAIINKNSAALNEVKDISCKDGQVIKVNQYELSEIVVSRINEILTLANQEINSLSSHKPNYIFVTGGITNMNNFNQICREKLGKCAIIGSVNLIGLRNNKFSSAIGNIIYFVNKLKLQGEDYSMIDSNDMESLVTPKKSNNDSMLGKLFGYFFSE